MMWLKITLIALHVISMIGTVATVGKERDPITPGVAAASTLISLGVIAGIMAL